jgi:RNA polymerase sigma factor (sigma-70 family)
MEAEDIMQESFLAAFDKINSYSGTVSFGSWLKKIVQNRSIDFVNKKKMLSYGDIEPYYSVEDKGDEPDCTENDPDPRINKVMRAIGKLPEKYRNIISLYLFEGYDHEEIGEILSIPSSTSRSNFSRARSRIIAEFGE